MSTTKCDYNERKPLISNNEISGTGMFVKYETSSQFFSSISHDYLGEYEYRPGNLGQFGKIFEKSKVIMKKKSYFRTSLNNLLKVFYLVTKKFKGS